MSTFEPSASARPFVTRGIALVIPPLPVPVPAPGPVRKNQVSSVNVAALNSGAAPKVTYWLDPLNVKDELPKLELAEVFQVGVLIRVPGSILVFPNVTY